MMCTLRRRLTGQHIVGHNGKIEMVEKLRAIDDCKRNLVNMLSSWTEKMKVSGIEEIACTIKMLKSSSKSANHKLHAFALDQSKAYRWILTKPDHRKYVVPTVWCPKKNKFLFCVLNSGCFGAASSVQNYNRMAKGFCDIMNSIFKIPLKTCASTRAFAWSGSRVIGRS